MAIGAVKKHNDLKRKDRVPEVIEISSDGEPEIWPSKVRHAARPPPSYTHYFTETKTGGT